MTVQRRLPPRPVFNPAAEAVVVGASAGALETLSKLLTPLPRQFRLPILVVVHLPPNQKSIIAECLQGKCELRIREADDKEPIVPGTVLIAPPDYHLMVDSKERLSLSSEEPVLYSRPSIDLLFESAADVYGSNVIGIILTGASADGANGLREIGEAGGVALVQQPELAYASTMPQAALDACPTAVALSVPEIATFLREGVVLK